MEELHRELYGGPKGDRGDTGPFFPRLVLCPQLGLAQHAQARRSSGWGSITQDGAWLKLIAEHNPVSVTVSDVVVFEERLINASFSRKVQEAAGC